MILYDYSKLLGKITEKYGTQGAFANAISLSERSLSLKLNNKLQFKQSEIERIVEMLELEPIDIPAFFFTRMEQ